MPVTIGIFINPGVFPDKKNADGKAESNRSFEYDTLIAISTPASCWKRSCPRSARNTNWSITRLAGPFAGSARAASALGPSPGNVPTLFSKVLSHVGSFTNIRGGHVYPALIRKTEPKPIRVFLAGWLRRPGQR